MDKKLSSPRITREILNKHKFRLTKSLGQNFLIDENILENIVSSAEITKEDTVIEIGTGIGTLTQRLCQEAGKVIAIEIDKNLIPILKDTLSAYDNLTIINEDVLKVDLKELLKDEIRPVKIVANLPYYITSPIIMKFFEEDVNFSTMVYMVQKEVAKRINAKESTKDYGVLTLAIRYYCKSEIAAIVPKTAFIPPPNVDSAVIKLTRSKEFETENKNEFFRLVKAGFFQRRKTILNSFSASGYIGSKEQILELLNKADIDPKTRGEALSIEKYVQMAKILSQM